MKKEEIKEVLKEKGFKENGGDIWVIGNPTKVSIVLLESIVVVNIFAEKGNIMPKVRRFKYTEVIEFIEGVEK